MAGRTRSAQVGTPHRERSHEPVSSDPRFGVGVKPKGEQDRERRPRAPRARATWDEQFRAMAERGDDRLLWSGALLPNQWDDAEWEW